MACLLVLAVVPGHSAMSGLGLNGLAVGAHKHRCHQSQRAETLKETQNIAGHFG